MISNTQDTQAFLDTGGTLVVPTVQRAAAVRLAHAAAHFAAQERVWTSPEVIPWAVFLARCREQLQREQGAVRRRTLNPLEEWLLWRDAVREACSDTGVLLPDTLIDAVRRSAALLEDWGIPLRAAVHEESALLLRARAGFAKRCDALQALDSNAWRGAQRIAMDAQGVWMRGLDDLGSVTRRWLLERGAVIQDCPASGALAAAKAVQKCADLHDEVQRMAGWCRQQLERDPGARLLLIVPSLADYELSLRRQLALQLQPGNLLRGSADDVLFAIEGGMPLPGYPLVRAALTLLHLAGGPLSFDEFAYLWRTPYLDLGPASACLQLELWLRQQNLVHVELQELQQIQSRVAVELGKEAGDALLRLVEAVAVPDGLRDVPAWWARRFAAVLRRCGWPGRAPLASREMQVRLQFDQLLGEFAGCGDASGRLDCRASLELLRTWVRQSALEPASDDVPVTVTGLLSAPLVRYDGIWIAGLTAEAWPRPPAPDPLVPLPLQRAAAVPAASTAGRLQQARRAMQEWSGSCGQLVCSWPEWFENSKQEPSPLLPAADFELPAPMAAPLLQRLHDSATTETIEPHGATTWPAARRLPGGTRLFELQAACPFRASAELRLDCVPLPQPVGGIDARSRGQLLHRALEYLWRDLKDSQSLRQRSASATLKVVEASAARAVEEVVQRLLQRPPAGLVRIEQQRTVQLMLQLLEVEREREPFIVEATEWTQTRVIGGFPSQLRLDRVDRLEDGVIVIDYKSGAPRRFDAHAERPSHAQLLAYSLVAGGKLLGLCTLHLTPRGIRWRGYADRSGRLPQLRQVAADAAEWQWLLQRWRSQIEALAGEFARGHADVIPQPKACTHCHLGLLCRIDSTVSGEDGTGDEPEDGP